MTLYYDLENKRLCSSSGISMRTAPPVLHFMEKPVWDLHVFESGDTLAPCTFSGAQSFRAAVDVDLNRSTDPICRTSDSGIGKSGLAEGSLAISLNASTLGFQSACAGAESRKAFFELWGYDGSAEPVFYIRFEIRISDVIDSDGGADPEEVETDSITRTETVALLRAGFDLRFTQDASDESAAHPVQTDDDLYFSFRNASAGGAWSPWILLPQGVDGQDGQDGQDGADGHDGADGRLIGASVSVSDLTDGEILVTHDAVPVAVKTDAGNIYPIEKGSLTSDSSGWHIDPAPYLAYDGAGSFTGPWTVYFAGGLPEIMTVIASGTSITPLEHQVYKHTLAASDVISIDTAGLTSSQCLTFEIWLDMPSAAVAFTLPTMEWVDGAAPDFSEGGTRYVIVVRWNGSKLLANLAYTEDLA